MLKNFSIWKINIWFKGPKFQHFSLFKLFFKNDIMTKMKKAKKNNNNNKKKKERKKRTSPVNRFWQRPVPYVIQVELVSARSGRPVLAKTNSLPASTNFWCLSRCHLDWYLLLSSTWYHITTLKNFQLRYFDPFYYNLNLITILKTKSDININNYFFKTSQLY